MKAFSLIVIFICCLCKYISVDIMPNLKRNILNFGYGINFKYGGMLSHSIDRFYVVMKFALLIIKDLKFSPIKFDSNCSYLNVDINRSKFPSNIFQILGTFVRKLYHLFISTRNKLIIIIEQLMKS